MAVFLVVSVAVVCLWLIPAAVQGQFSDCSMLLESELGNTTVPVQAGLLYDALTSAGGEGPLLVQLVEFNPVCLAQGSVNNTYRSISLIASYIPSDGSETTTQLHLQCIDGAWSTVNFGSSATSASTPPGGNLTTSVRRDCFLCLNPDIGEPVTPVEHCLSEFVIATTACMES